jgi:ribonuclease Z
MNYLYKAWIDHEPIQLKGTQYTLQGFSIAGYRTNFYIKELDLMLDAGISANFVPKKILITHGHADHIANLPFHLYGSLDKDEDKIQIWMPQEIEKLIKNFNDSMFRLTFNDKNASFNFYDSIPVQPTQKIDFQNKSGKYQIEIFKCDHTVPCVGYGFCQIKKHLKEEYKGVSGKELGALKKSGTKIEDEYMDYQFVFLGDTTAKMFEFEENKNIFLYKTIIIECSFLEEDDIKHSISKKHNHWIFMKPIIQQNPKINFILIHFSSRYKKQEIEDFFARETGVSNVTLWCH